ncbi:unnamed protein product [Leuciscus chuanchicus]
MDFLGLVMKRLPKKLAERSALIPPETREGKPQDGETERELASANGSTECFLLMTKIKIQKHKQTAKYLYVVTTSTISTVSPGPLCKNSSEKSPECELAKFQCRIASFTQVANTHLQEEN